MNKGRLVCKERAVLSQLGSFEKLFYQYPDRKKTLIEMWFLSIQFAIKIITELLHLFSING